MLGARLAALANRDDVIVLALPRGGVPIGFEVAQKLRAPLDVLVTRKLGFPGNEELAMGAIAPNGARYLNEEALDLIPVSDTLIDQVAARERIELRRREVAYRQGAPALPIEGKVALLVDDGIATGSTMHAAARAARDQNPSRIIVAVPTAPKSVHEDFSNEADEVISLITPDYFRAVGCWYASFPQVSDAEVIRLLALSRAEHARG